MIYCCAALLAYINILKQNIQLKIQVLIIDVRLMKRGVIPSKRIILKAAKTKMVCH